jgi:hypothetical protein
MKNLLLFICICHIVSLKAQNIGIGIPVPNPSALLHVNSTNKGILIPQVGIDSLKDVTSIPAPAQGLIVYNITQPGIKNDMARGYYYYSTLAGTWIRFADNFNDNVWQKGGFLGIQLRNTTDGVEIMDNYTVSALNYSPKVKILKMMDSSLLNSKNNINTLVLTGVNSGKLTAAFENRQKTTILFENSYLLSNGVTSSTITGSAISGYTENIGAVGTNYQNGLAFYTYSMPNSTLLLDTPSMSIFRHNIAIGAYATDINNVTEGRLQITGLNNGDQLSLRHPSSINLKWGLYVSAMDSSLNFYSNGSLRANIDRVTGVFSALSDRTKKKNILPIYSVLETLKKMPIYSYQYLDSKAEDRRQIGLMAQDIQPHFPELVYQRYDREKDKPLLMMDYSGLSVIALKAIQEQQAIIDDLKNKDQQKQIMVDQLKLMMEQLTKEIEILEKKN